MEGKMKDKKIVFFSVLLYAWITCLPVKASAHENIFGFVYLTETLPRGKWEVEQVYEGKYGKHQGRYANSYFRTELEYGVTDRFQASAYVNTRHVYAHKNNVDGTTGGENVPDNRDSDQKYNRYKFESISLEGIYQLLNLYKDPIGLALYLEPAFGSKKYEIEPKLLFQKNFLEDRLVLALNIAWEMEWAREKDEEGMLSKWEHEMEYQNTLGASYLFAQNWRAGVEFQNVNKFGTFSLHDAEHSAYFLGPDLHYANKNYWITGAVLFQLPVAHGFSEEQREIIQGGRIFGHERSAVQLNVKMGWSF